MPDTTTPAPAPSPVGVLSTAFWTHLGTQLALLILGAFSAAHYSGLPSWAQALAAIATPAAMAYLQGTFNNAHADVTTAGIQAAAAVNTQSAAASVLRSPGT